jgi:hypothetical protein
VTDDRRQKEKGDKQNEVGRSWQKQNLTET